MFFTSGALQNEHIDRYYGFLLGQVGFAAEENQLYDLATRAATLALTLNTADAWAVHALTHVHEVLLNLLLCCHFQIFSYVYFSFCIFGFSSPIFCTSAFAIHHHTSQHHLYSSYLFYRCF